MYLIVEFEEGDIALVPSCWMAESEKSVKWPPYKNYQRLTNAASKQELPTDEWIETKVKRVMYRSEHFDKARRKLKEAEEESDLMTDSCESSIPQKRKRVAKQYSSDEESSSEERPAVVLARNQQSLQKTKPTNPSGPSPTPSGPSQSPKTLSSPAPPPRMSLSGAAGRQQQLLPTSSQQTVLTGIKQILTNQEKIKVDIADLRQMVQLLHSGQINDDPGLPEEIKLPVCSMEAMLHLNNLLHEEKNLTAVVKHLSMFCAATVKESVSRLLTEVMSNDVAFQFNMTGAKGKSKFKDLQVMMATYKCLRRNAATKSATRKEVEEEVTKWLAGARDRDGRRKTRRGGRNTEELDPH